VDLILFAKASLVGLSIAAPVGPIGLICIQRTLSQGAKAGFSSGLGAATADGIYGAIGAFGLTTVTHAFTSASRTISLVGVVFLGWLGIRFLRAGPPGDSDTPATTRDSLRAFASTLVLTLANPATILSFAAVFAALSGSTILDPNSAGTLIAGVFFGSAIWWLALATGVSRIRHRIDASAMQWISRIAGGFLLGFAGWQLYSVII
jgi:threonine/homoserine/homoserine lactone efflux protein